MFVRVKKFANRKSVVQLVEGIRDPVTNKVRQKVLRHIGSASSEEELEDLKKLALHIKFDLESEHQPSLFAPEQIFSKKIKAEKNRENESELEKEGNSNYQIDDIRELAEEAKVITGVADIYGKLYEQLGFHQILGRAKHQKHANETLQHLVLARIANPQSKKETVRFLESDYGVTLNLDSVYKTMDKIDDQIVESIQDYALRGAQALFNEKIDVLFYDATTLYFESFTEDELKSKGFSKDHKNNEVQILLSVFVTQAVIPIGYEIFHGSTYEGHSLITALAKLKARFDIEKIIFVADSGMLNKDNLSLLEQSEYQYIVGARLKNMSQAVKKEILSRDEYQILSETDEEAGSYKIINLDDKKKLLIHHSPLRARKDGHDRDEAICKLMKKLQKGKKVKSFVSSSGYKKYLTVNEAAPVSVNEDKICEDAQWDGLFGVTTNIASFNPQELLTYYRGLWQIEETFRIGKHDLKIRPIYHWTPSRIKAHMAICFMALTCVRHLEYRVGLKNQKLSPAKIRQSLTATGITILKHKQDHRRFAVPFKDDAHAKEIYKIMNLPFKTTPYLL